MLNKMLERLPLLLTEGIDYKATHEAMREAQEESRHLWQFAREVGLEVQSGGRVWVKDLWEQLQAWYEDAGILERETSGTKEKQIWNELSNKYIPEWFIYHFCIPLPLKLHVWLKKVITSKPCVVRDVRRGWDLNPR